VNLNSKSWLRKSEKIIFNKVCQGSELGVETNSIGVHSLNRVLCAYRCREGEFGGGDHLEKP